MLQTGHIICFLQYSLGNWLSNQKQNYGKGNLSADRIKRLEDIGFTWDILEEQFEKGFQQTLLYKNRTGNPNAPLSYKTVEGYSLGNWQRGIMDRYRKENVSADRVKRLEDIGFKWTLFDEPFNKGFEETLLYKNNTGSPNAPLNHKTAEGFRLGYWQGAQRGHYKKGDLSPDRIKRLENIGFTWDKFEEQFEKGFQETLKYKEKTGNANAPQGYKTREGFRLGVWQDAKRAKYKGGNLSQDRILRLERIGFKWTLFDESFNRGFEETLKYKMQFGDAYAPQNYKTSEGFPLGRWQHAQRQLYRNGKMDPKRAKQFEEIGYDWYRYEKALRESWEQAFQETMNYIELNGNPHAPYEYVTPEGFPLGQWQTDQKQFYKKGKLAQDRIERLEHIGFKWDKYESELEYKFDSNFDELLKYRQDFGNTKVTKGYKTRKGTDLGSWVMFMRSYYRKGKLSKDRIEKLNNIGFMWTPKSEFIVASFNRGIEESNKYKSLYRNVNAPISYITDDGYKLGQWQTTIRQKYRNNKLREEQIILLESLEFKWKLK